MTIRAETNIDFKDILDNIPLTRAEFLDLWGVEVTKFCVNRWVGWVEETGTSRAGWHFYISQDQLVVHNDVGYSGYVHRAGTPKTNIEADNYFDELVANQADKMVNMMADALEDLF